MASRVKSGFFSKLIGTHSTSDDISVMEVRHIGAKHFLGSTPIASPSHAASGAEHFDWEPELEWNNYRQNWVLKQVHFSSSTVLACGVTYALRSSHSGQVGVTYLLTALHVDEEKYTLEYTRLFVEKLIAILATQEAPSELAGLPCFAVVLLANSGRCRFEELGFQSIYHANYTLAFSLPSLAPYFKDHAHDGASKYGWVPIMGSVGVRTADLTSEPSSPIADALHTFCSINQLEWHMVMAEEEAKTLGQKPLSIFGGVVRDAATDAVVGTIAWRPRYQKNELLIMHVSASDEAVFAFMLEKALAICESEDLSVLAMFYPSAGFVDEEAREDGLPKLDPKFHYLEPFMAFATVMKRSGSFPMVYSLLDRASDKPFDWHGLESGCWN